MVNKQLRYQGDPFLFLIGVILISLLLTRCKESGVETDVSNPVSAIDTERELLKSLEEKGMMNYNDSAKWLLYTTYFKDLFKPVEGEGVELPLSFLEIRLNAFEDNGDSLALYYMIYYNDSTPVNNLPRENPVADGILFDVKNTHAIGYLMSRGIYSETGEGGKYFNPLRPEVISFFNSNANNLNKWLKKEAARRGVLSD